MQAMQIHKELRFLMGRDGSPSLMQRFPSRAMARYASRSSGLEFAAPMSRPIVARDGRNSSVFLCAWVTRLPELSTSSVLTLKDCKSAIKLPADTSGGLLLNTSCADLLT